jgi:hypothetical protein
MVLHPISNSAVEAVSSISAWQAVEKTQKCDSREWWLIAQPDHAALAGDLASLLNYPLFPQLSTEVLRAISAHDAGWAQFDSSSDTATRPVSFLEIGPAEFLIAWTGSIDAAASIGPLGGLIVSGHFQRLARTRLQSNRDGAEDIQRVQNFLLRESHREKTLIQRAGVSAQEISELTDVLQFCDLVSLYLCCGSRDPVVFPQRFGETTISGSRHGDVVSFEPAIFGSGASLGVSARRYPGAQAGTLPFLLG